MRVGVCEMIEQLPVRRGVDSTCKEVAILHFDDGFHVIAIFDETRSILREAQFA